MKIVLHAAAAFAAVAILSWAPGLAQTQPLPPVEAFGQLPDLSKPTLSPDGKHLAAVTSYEGRPVALIYDLSAPPGTKPVVLPYDRGFISSVTWANNDRLLIAIKSTAQVEGDIAVNAWYRTASVDAKGTNAVVLLNNVAARGMNYNTSDIAGLDLDDPDHIYMPLWYEAEGATAYDAQSAGRFTNDLFRVDVNTGKAEKFMVGSSDAGDWFLDGHGHVVARVAETKNPLVDHVLVNQSGSWKEIASYDATGDKGAAIFGLNADGSALVRSVDAEDSGTTALAELSLAGGTGKVLASNPQYDVDAALTDPWTARVIGYRYTDDKAEYKYFDPKMQGLETAFPGMAVHPASWSLALDKVIVSVSGARQPEIYYLLDRTTHQADVITSTYPALNPADLGDVKPYPYAARDGLAIPAYLTLPPGKAPHNLPTVILPHGGPVYRDDMSFDWMAQFFASRGYAVLQPNFRGSSGYGAKFRRAGYGEWGRKMQDDITDGVKKLIADGVADPKRICIVGASYGGYAALAGAAFTPDLYACAASWAGVSDITQMLTEDYDQYGRSSSTMSVWSLYIGDRFKDADKIAAISPVNSVDRIKCPVLLMHGTKDTTVRFNQSQIMRDALERAGKQVQYVAFDNETHYMETADTRIRVLTELEKFLKANIGN